MSGAVRRKRNGVEAMEWFFIEALFALLVAVVIVTWTMWPARRKPPRSADGDRGGDAG